MDREPVVSSNLASVGYDSASQVLEVEFKGGGVYQYHGVPESVHRNLMHAPSKGIFLSRHIKDKYRYEKVRESA